MDWINLSEYDISDLLRCHTYSIMQNKQANIDTFVKAGNRSLLLQMI